MQKPVLALQDFIDQSSIVWNQQGDRPALNSQAAVELANFSRPESIVTAYSQALLLFETAIDYSTALIKTLTEPAQSVAPWSCARSVLETSALALWLWDTNIDARQRVQRSLAFRYAGLTQQLKFAQISNESLSKNKIVERLDAVEQIAHSIGFAKVTDKKKGKRIGIAQPMPTVTEIIIKMLDRESNYRLLSAMVHGHAWALQPLSFGKASETQEIFDGVKGKYIEKHLDYSSIVYLCVESLACISTSIITKFKLYGWNVQQMGVLIDKTRKELEEQL